ncbi:SDR family NAD(P)-dependent oxidoreductase [Paenibacillus graminis]
MPPLDKLGAFAEYVAVDAAIVAKMPANLSFKEAAAVPLSALTIIQALAILDARKGAKLFIPGGTGGFGQIALPYAKSQGMFVTISGNGSARALAERLGADEFIDYATQDYTDLLTGYDYVIDTRGAGEFCKQIKILKPGGKAIHYPKLDIVFNNAGIMHEFDLFDESITYEHLAAEITTNLNGTIYVTKALLPLLAKQQEAMIVNVSSLLANITVANAPTYSATKAGVHMFSDALREQIRAKGKKIHVMELCPPVISETNLTDTYNEGFLNKMISLPLAKLVNAGIKGMEKNKLRVNAGFSKVMRFSMKFAPDFITHTWGQMILKAK